MSKKLTTTAGCPVVDNQNAMTAGPRGPQLLQDVWFLEKLAHFDREVIPERRMHAKGSGAYGSFTVTKDITKYTRAKIFSRVGKKTELFARFTTVAGERGAADAERDIRGFAVKFYTEEGNWDLVGNNTPVFFLRDPLKFPDLNHAVKREPPLSLTGAADHWNHREDADYYSQPGALFRLMTPAQQQTLFENTARSIGGAPKSIQLRHIRNCLKADAAYGAGIARALGIPLSEAG